MFRKNFGKIPHRSPAVYEPFYGPKMAVKMPKNGQNGRKTPKIRCFLPKSAWDGLPERNFSKTGRKIGKNRAGRLPCAANSRTLKRGRQTGLVRRPAFRLDFGSGSQVRTVRGCSRCRPRLGRVCCSLIRRPRRGQLQKDATRAGVAYKSNASGAGGLECAPKQPRSPKKKGRPQGASFQHRPV